jgi:hypothetical protein
MPMRSLGAFGPEAIAEMGEVLEAACEELGDNSQPEAVREIVALRIIAAARLGERDPVRCAKPPSANETRSAFPKFESYQAALSSLKDQV